MAWCTDHSLQVLWKPIEGADPKKKDPRAPYCRYTKLDSTTLLCLLDRQVEELEYITFAQPPHQQRFSLGYNLTSAGIPEFNLTQLYTRSPPVAPETIDPRAPPPKTDWPPLTNQPDSTETANWYDPVSRMVRLATLAKAVNQKLTFGSPTGSSTDPAYLDYVPNSAELAMELNDKAYYFRLLPSKSITDSGETDKLGETDVRQLWCKENRPWTTDPEESRDTTATDGIGENKDAGEAAGISQGDTVVNPPIPAPFVSPSGASASTNVTVTGQAATISASTNNQFYVCGLADRV